MKAMRGMPLRVPSMEGLGAIASTRQKERMQGLLLTSCPSVTRPNRGL